ncbi:hypothetical protein JXA85_00810 [Candidatus Woesearchaeota archaeon]|nr:hypothetical protein [Candidatus Woesearchaeota archaeon]
MNDNYVRIMKCRFCGKNTNAIALHRQLKPIKEDVFDTEPCDKCKGLFNTHKYFIGDCGHQGFVKTSALQQVVKAELFESMADKKIFRMEKCFACLGMIKMEDCPTI